MTVSVFLGDCVEALKARAPGSPPFDSCVTDPPYFLTSIQKRFGGKNAAAAKDRDGLFQRASGGFMGCGWDAPDDIPLDPGFAHWLAGFIDGEGCFSVHKKTVNGCQTFDCQFSMQLRDDDHAILVECQKKLGGIGSLHRRPAHGTVGANPQSRWCVSSQADCLYLREVLTAFPLRAKKARDFEIWSAALDEWVAHTPGTTWERVAYLRERLMAVKRYGAFIHPMQVTYYRWFSAVYDALKPGAHLVAFSGTRTFHRMVCAIEDAGFEIRDQLAWAFGSGFPKSHDQGDGWGTALKPAWEPICLARKPLSEKSVAANVLRWGTGALNIDGCRVETADEWSASTRGASDSIGTFKTGDRTTEQNPLGRWPANLVHDGSEEVLAGFPESDSKGGGGSPASGYWGNAGACEGLIRDDQGSAARFFYTAKAGPLDRLGSPHPTIKPVDLMRWLCRLVTPAAGRILDPFAGSGSTGIAAMAEGFDCELIDIEEKHVADIRRKLAIVQGEGRHRMVEMNERKAGRQKPLGGLFGEAAA